VSSLPREIHAHDEFTRLNSRSEERSGFNKGVADFTGACPVGPADRTGVAPGDGTGVKFMEITACPVEFPVGNPIQQGGRISLGRPPISDLQPLPSAS